MAIHAGAGSGKTRTITHRIAYGVAEGRFQPNRTLAVTFTNRAAGELRSRLAQLDAHGVQVRTFHSAALRQLRHFYPQVFGKNLPSVISSKAHLVSQAAASCKVSIDREMVRDLSSEIEWAKSNIVSPDMYRALTDNRVSSLTVIEVAHVYEAYMQLLDQNNSIDFEDVLLLTLAVMKNNPDVAAQVHQQYHHFTVDEFQDVSPVQFELLTAWLGTRQDVCVVGDVAQTIYSFAGATSEYLQNFPRYFPQAQVFEITQSYRSTPEIVTFANRIGAQESKITLKSVRKSGSKVEIASFSDDESEAKKVASSILKLIESGSRAEEVAVLFRMNSQSEPLESALSDLGIPFTLRGTERFFERSEVRNAILNLRATNSELVASTLSATVRQVLSGIGWQATMPLSGRAEIEKWESLESIVRLSTDFEREHSTATVVEFVGHLDARAQLEHAPAAQAVTLTSIHSAKGLEWAHVFLIGCSEGLLPISYAKNISAVAEERRLMYVAVTRAQDSLSLSWAKARNQGTSAFRKPSQFLPDH